MVPINPLPPSLHSHSCRFNDDALQANLNIQTAEEITLAEDSLTTISATAPKMAGFGAEATENFEELEALSFRQDAANMSVAIEVG
jgi:hypothetical protein